MRAHDFFQLHARRAELAGLQAQACQAELGPGQIGLGQHQFQDGPGRAQVAHLLVDLGLRAQHLGHVLAFGQALLAQGQGLGEILGAAGTDDVGHRRLALQQALQARLQRTFGDGLEQVVVRRLLGGHRDHVGVLLGRDHDPHGRGRDPALVARLLQQHLAVLAVAEVVVAQHDVIGVARQQPRGFVGRSRGVHALRTAAAQQAADHAAHGFEILHEEEVAAAERVDTHR